MNEELKIMEKWGGSWGGGGGAGWVAFGGGGGSGWGVRVDVNGELKFL